MDRLYSSTLALSLVAGASALFAALSARTRRLVLRASIVAWCCLLVSLTAHIAGGHAPGSPGALSPAEFLRQHPAFGAAALAPAAALVLRRRSLVAAAPVIFAAHVVEEAPRFVPYFNGLVDPDITMTSFLAVNGVAFLLTVLAAVALAATDDPLPGAAALAWLAFLFLANALFHIVATLVYARYSPGVVTAATLYLPCFVLTFRHVVRHHRVHVGAAWMATAVGALPMLVHGYLIVFRGSRLI